MATTISSATTAATTSSASTSRTALAGNFDTFLTLLTTQLKNQSPLDPLNTNEFTQQLVQFASIEQQLKSNDNLTALISATRSNAIAGALGLVGATVTADGATSRFDGAATEWKLQVPRSVTNATVTITDSTGATVFSEQRAFAAGQQGYSWKGKTMTGATAPYGEYTVNVTAFDAAGQSVAVRAEMQGAVSKVDVSGTEPQISIGNISIPLSKVKTIQKN
jgi:flagellar basal-body rod modification protein FlgD